MLIECCILQCNYDRRPLKIALVKYNIPGSANAAINQFSPLATGKNINQPTSEMIAPGSSQRHAAKIPITIKASARNPT